MFDLQIGLTIWHRVAWHPCVSLEPQGLSYYCMQIKLDSSGPLPHGYYLVPFNFLQALHFSYPPLPTSIIIELFLFHNTL